MNRKALDVNVFQQGIALLSLVTPDYSKNDEESKAKTKLMYAMLSDLPADKFLSGIGVMVRVHKQVFPGTNVVALIRGYALDEEYLSPEEAWGALQTAIRHKRYFQSLREVIEDDLVRRSVEIMGAKNIQFTENEDITRAHFFRVYAAILDRRKKEIARGF